MRERDVRNRNGDEGGWLMKIDDDLTRADLIVMLDQQTSLVRRQQRSLDDLLKVIHEVRRLASSGGIAAPVLTEYDRGYNGALVDLRKAMGQ